MVNQSLVKYIELCLKKGQSLSRIRETLINAGHPVEAIEEAITSINIDTKKIKSDKHYVLLIGIILGIIILSGLLFFAYAKYSDFKEYNQAIETLEDEQSFSLMSDVDLIKYAKLTDSTESCKFIEGYITRTHCMNKLWSYDKCRFDVKYFESARNCYLEDLFLKRFGKLAFSVCQDDLVESCFYNYAANSKNLSLCHGDPDCISNYLVFNDLSESLCFDSSDISACFENLEESLFDSNICFRNDFLSPDCLYSSGDYSMLGKYYDDLAKSSGSKSALSTMLDNNYSNQYCEYLDFNFEDVSASDYCYGYYALKNSDNGFCHLINDDSLNNCCYSYSVDDSLFDIETFFNEECFKNLRMVIFNE